VGGGTPVVWMHVAVVHKGRAAEMVVSWGRGPAECGDLRVKGGPPVWGWAGGGEESRRPRLLTADREAGAPTNGGALGPAALRWAVLRWTARWWTDHMMPWLAPFRANLLRVRRHPNLICRASVARSRQKDVTALLCADT
jgi:hypothetical protein